MSPHQTGQIHKSLGLLLEDVLLGRKIMWVGMFLCRHFSVRWKVLGHTFPKIFDIPWSKGAPWWSIDTDRVKIWKCDGPTYGKNKGRCLRFLYASIETTLTHSGELSHQLHRLQQESPLTLFLSGSPLAPTFASSQQAANLFANWANMSRLFALSSLCSKPQLASRQICQ